MISIFSNTDFWSFPFCLIESAEDWTACSSTCVCTPHRRNTCFRLAYSSQSFCLHMALKLSVLCMIQIHSCLMAQLIDSSMLQTKLATEIPSSHMKNMHLWMLINRTYTGEAPFWGTQVNYRMKYSNASKYYWKNKKKDESTRAFLMKSCLVPLSLHMGLWCPAKSSSTFIWVDCVPYPL